MKTIRFKLSKEHKPKNVCKVINKTFLFELFKTVQFFK